MRRDSVTPVNTEGMHFFEIESIDVAEWHELPDGQGKPSQVHLTLTLVGFPYPLVMRFKSRRPVDELIVALNTHANGVWPKKD
jgi:hypothetical protein